MGQSNFIFQLTQTGWESPIPDYQTAMTRTATAVQQHGNCLPQIWTMPQRNCFRSVNLPLLLFFCRCRWRATTIADMCAYVLAHFWIARTHTHTHAQLLLGHIVDFTIICYSCCCCCVAIENCKWIELIDMVFCVKRTSSNTSWHNSHDSFHLAHMCQCD